MRLVVIIVLIFLAAVTLASLWGIWTIETATLGCVTAANPPAAQSAALAGC